ncbi:hypothetical protein QQ008_00300 [Fulvivirgaceae bacterium BMA10]|uniref:Uncharacterized protein n=1 Tax=Splendidivirga corallicola TaxID=3051826 RepID=A0ABT8KH57_9BACT|nr:hypothetical protein [Fulvivirgaceae bacterium BMA10]
MKILKLILLTAFSILTPTLFILQGLKLAEKDDQLAESKMVDSEQKLLQDLMLNDLKNKNKQLNDKNRTDSIFYKTQLALIDEYNNLKIDLLRELGNNDLNRLFSQIENKLEEINDGIKRGNKNRQKEEILSDINQKIDSLLSYFFKNKPIEKIVDSLESISQLRFLDSLSKYQICIRVNKDYNTNLRGRKNRQEIDSILSNYISFSEKYIQSFQRAKDSLINIWNYKVRIIQPIINSLQERKMKLEGDSSLTHYGLFVGVKQFSDSILHKEMEESIVKNELRLINTITSKVTQLQLRKADYEKLRSKLRLLNDFKLFKNKEIMKNLNELSLFCKT